MFTGGHCAEKAGKSTKTLGDKASSVGGEKLHKLIEDRLESSGVGPVPIFPTAVGEQLDSGLLEQVSCWSGGVFSRVNG